MKKLCDVFSVYLKPMAGLFLIAILFSACKKDDNINSNSRVPVAGLMAINLAPDQSAVVFSISENRLGNGTVSYSNFTGTYLPVYAGDRSLKATDFISGATLFENNNNFSDSMYYSAFLMGANGHYRSVVVNDQLNSLSFTPGKAWVRYVNAIPDSTSSTAITIGGDNPVNTPYATVSAYTQVDAGMLSASISNGTTIAATRNITVDENGVYTIMFIGLPAATDPSQAVQVKFIKNGTITP